MCDFWVCWNRDPEEIGVLVILLFTDVPPSNRLALGQWRCSINIGCGRGKEIAQWTERDMKDFILLQQMWIGRGRNSVRWCNLGGVLVLEKKGLWTWAGLGSHFLLSDSCKTSLAAKSWRLFWAVIVFKDHWNSIILVTVRTDILRPVFVGLGCLLTKLHGSLLHNKKWQEQD